MCLSPLLRLLFLWYNTINIHVPMTQSFFFYAPKIIFDFLFDVGYFLPWWYSRGLTQTAGSLWRFTLQKENELALGIWLRNFHKPLLNDYGFGGRVKSIIVRIFQIVFRLFFFVCWIVCAFLLFALYFIAPVLIGWQIIFQII